MIKPNETDAPCVEGLAFEFNRARQGVTQLISASRESDMWGERLRIWRPMSPVLEARAFVGASINRLYSAPTIPAITGSRPSTGARIAMS